MRSVTLINSVRSRSCQRGEPDLADDPGVMARSFIAKLPRPPFHFRQKPFAVGSPTQRAFQALRLGARSAQYRFFQKETVLAETRARRAEAGVGRTLGMFHFFDRFRIGSQAEPLGDLAQIPVR